MRIYNLGSLNIDYVYAVDHFVTAGETLSSGNRKVFPGGKGLNQSIAAARAGAEVIHGCIIGADGDFLSEIMADSDVDTSRLKKSDVHCGHAIIQVNKNGENCILLFAGSNHSIDRSYVESFLSDAQPDDILLLQNETNALDIVFEVAQKKKMQIAFNPSPFHRDILRLPLALVKWWFCNEIEGEALFGGRTPEEVVSNFSKLHPNSNLILTLGSKGSIFKSSKEIITQPIYKTKVVDTTAAGDTFTGYFLAEIVKGRCVQEALNTASKAAAVAVSEMGAAASIPTMEQVANAVFEM